MVFLSSSAPRSIAFHSAQHNSSVPQQRSKSIDALAFIPLDVKRMRENKHNLRQDDSMTIQEKLHQLHESVWENKHRPWLNAFLITVQTTAFILFQTSKRMSKLKREEKTQIFTKRSHYVCWKWNRKELCSAFVVAFEFESFSQNTTIPSIYKLYGMPGNGIINKINLEINCEWHDVGQQKLNRTFLLVCLSSPYLYSYRRTAPQHRRFDGSSWIDWARWAGCAVGNVNSVKCSVTEICRSPFVHPPSALFHSARFEFV